MSDDFTTAGLTEGIAQRLSRINLSSEVEFPGTSDRRGPEHDKFLLDNLILDARLVLNGKWPGQIKEEKE